MYIYIYIYRERDIDNILSIILIIVIIVDEILALVKELAYVRMLCACACDA